MTASAYPEIVVGRRDGFEQGAWRIEIGSSRRGDASCNLTERVLRVPLGSNATARVVRAHELMHVRVSPHTHWPSLHVGISPRSLECAEEFRVNELLARLGFPIELLCDGTEKSGARHIGDEGDWPETLRFFVAVLGTDAEREFLSGVRKSQPTWSAPLRALRRRVLKMVASMDVAEIGDTNLDVDGVPRGYANVTVVLATMIDRASQSQIPSDPESLAKFRRSLEPGARRAPSGVFAVLEFQPSLETFYRASRSTWQRPRPTVSGTVMRYPSRLLSDEYQRAFASKRPCRGGVVVIDQSGSMDIDPAEIEMLVRRAPGALVVGYSHEPGNLIKTPNAWILAQGGILATSFPPGHVGNGVDAPILRWALSRARGVEPVVWVTDGQVTDSNDHPNDALSEECAQLVRRHKIRLVREVANAGSALARHRPLVHSDFGRVGRKLLEIRGF